jgi:hypothetical protein
MRNTFMMRQVWRLVGVLVLLLAGLLSVTTIRPDDKPKWGERNQPDDKPKWGQMYQLDGPRWISTSQHVV